MKAKGNATLANLNGKEDYYSMKELLGSIFSEVNSMITKGGQKTAQKYAKKPQTASDFFFPEYRIRTYM